MNSYYPIIGIAGKAGSGKTTAANYIKEKYTVKEIVLADPIKELLFQCGTSEEALYGPSEKRDLPADICKNDNEIYNHCMYLASKVVVVSHGDVLRLGKYLKTINNKATVRQASQWIGTEWGRGIDKDVWINHGIKRAKYELYYGANRVLIPDLRFRNEILAIKEIGGMVINIERFSDKESFHTSETELDTVPDSWYDYHIFNNTNRLQALYEEIQNLMELHHG